MRAADPPDPQQHPECPLPRTRQSTGEEQTPLCHRFIIYYHPGLAVTTRFANQIQPGSWVCNGVFHAGSPLLPDHQEAHGPVGDQGQAQQEEQSTLSLTGPVYCRCLSYVPQLCQVQLCR